MWPLRGRVLELFSSSRSMRGLSVLGGCGSVSRISFLGYYAEYWDGIHWEDLDNRADSKKAPSNKIYDKI